MLKKLLVLSLFITQSLAFAKESTIVSPAKEPTKFQVAEETNSDSTNTDKEEKKKKKKKKKVKKAYPERHFRRYFLGGLVPASIHSIAGLSQTNEEKLYRRNLAFGMDHDAARSSAKMLSSPGIKAMAFLFGVPVMALIYGGVAYGVVKIYDRIRGPVEIKKPEKKAEKKSDKKAKAKKKYA